MTEIQFLNFDSITNEYLQESRKCCCESVFSMKKKKKERKENLRLPGLQVDTQNGH